jgi:hypothetical protein
VDLDIQIADVNLLENLMGDLKELEFTYTEKRTIPYKNVSFPAIFILLSIAIAGLILGEPF